MEDKEIMALTKSIISDALDRHNERIQNGRYVKTSADNSDDNLAELIALSDKSSKEYANSLVYSLIKKLSENNPGLFDAESSRQ